MRLATIDVGSNSIHLLVVDVEKDGKIVPVDRERDMVRLGAHSLTRGSITEAASQIALRSFRRLVELARHLEAERVVATGTSALRESRNRDEFVERALRETGVRIEILSGQEEARLVALAVNHAMRLGTTRTLIVDVGGGSTEFAITKGREPLLLRSVKLGAVRLTDACIRSDPPSPRDVARLDEQIRDGLARTRRAVANVGYERAVATSGTALALARLVARFSKSASSPLTLDAVRIVRERLALLSVKESRRLPGVNPRRADILFAGAMLVERILELFAIEKLETCDWGLREGVLLHLLRDTLVGEAAERRTLRRRSVLGLARRYQYDAVHSRQVAHLAKKLFDATAVLHGLGAAHREILEHAAVLHDIGYFVSDVDHHKHTQYLVAHSELQGFTRNEVAVIANVARYHRKSLPRDRHPGFTALGMEEREIVRKLAAILRLADALDRSHACAIADVEVSIGPQVAEVRARSRGSIELERLATRHKSDLFERVFGRRVRLRDLRRPASPPVA
ncbi:MAG: Ppx/GppA family phosphatase [Planctomycetes bacterium]|nr:Ppx/GppA family phosphatase [Planctomycetota bacterium]MBI3847088.1 Ppx/GppA family phosphatase [Planctomycetota bacterium]